MTSRNRAIVTFLGILAVFAITVLIPVRTKTVQVCALTGSTRTTYDWLGLETGVEETDSPIAAAYQNAGGDPERIWTLQRQFTRSIVGVPLHMRTDDTLAINEFDYGQQTRWVENATEDQVVEFVSSMKDVGWSERVGLVRAAKRSLTPGAD